MIIKIKIASGINAVRALQLVSSVIEHNEPDGTYWDDKLRVHVCQGRTQDEYTVERKLETVFTTPARREGKTLAKEVCRGGSIT